MGKHKTPPETSSDESICTLVGPDESDVLKEEFEWWIDIIYYEGGSIEVSDR